MDEKNISDKNYELGFNEGYIISQHLPELSNQIEKIKNEAPRIEGMKDGIKEYLLERANEEYPLWLNSEPQKKDKPRNRDLEPDR